MNSSSTNVGGWPATSMRTFVNNDIYNALPTDLKNAIIDTTTVSGHGSTNGEKNFTSIDKLYFLAPGEIFTDWNTNSISSYDTAKELTRALDYYANINVTTSNSSNAIKKNGVNTSYWWLRSAISENYFNFFNIYSNGAWNSDNAFIAHGVSPAFRIG